MDRRSILGMMAGAAVLPAVPSLARNRDFGGAAFLTEIKRIEVNVGGRLGVAVLDMATGARAAWRGDERFAMCSTFKFLLAAAVLDAVEAGRFPLDRAVPIAQSDLVANSPVATRNVGGTLSIAELCEATMTVSDNTAANLLLPLIGGPVGQTAFMRSISDRVTRLDRDEPEMSDSTPGDLRDTTSPLAMLGSMRALLFGPRLTPASRERLTGWLIANKTGDTRLRAGLAKSWRVGDKTGTGGHGTVNDVGVMWPTPGRRPILVTSFLTQSSASQAVRYAAHAEVGRAIATAVG